MTGGGATAAGDACFVLTGLDVGLEIGLCSGAGLGILSGHASLCLDSMLVTGSVPVVLETPHPHFWTKRQ